MKLYELYDSLQDDELDVILKESIASELSGMIQSNVSKPFQTFHSQLISDFSKRLKAWAVMSMTELRKGGEASDSKQYIKTLEKIINNPQGVASQLINKTIAKVNEPEYDKDICV